MLCLRALIGGALQAFRLKKTFLHILVTIVS